ncbi:hypothetical protein FIV42_22770 [Persicimonas caeni]|uniref:SCP domain-containing protein n=1 Tax=Persicimonas caeni TaxID=2292766 RepID=A0A4Y6PYW9_PERCE|nr:CAP domain-containing protein [Persicimonas caeni]QDG53463.1 hypothetical protein FIV42_22770 [Persicimonas caeni]QED34684.1 hypothetical protein FRD00_22765 [Persicimonas caeni]
MTFAVPAARRRARFAVHALVLIASFSLVACGDDIAPPSQGSGDAGVESHSDDHSEQEDSPSFAPPTVTPDDGPAYFEPVERDAGEPAPDSDESDPSDSGTYEPTPIDDAGTGDEPAEEPPAEDDQPTNDAPEQDDEPVDDTPEPPQQPDTGSTPDAGSTPDTGGWDAGEPDTSQPDTSQPDPSQPDAGSGGGGTVIDCRDASTWPSAWVQLEDQILQMTNAERAAGASCGGSFYSPQPALTADPQLREAARCHSMDMAIQNYFSHTSANGDSMSDRINATGYPWRSIGENIAAGYRTPSSAMTGWMNSSGHCRNIMSGFTELGVGYYNGGSGGYGHYWTQNFGIPSGSSSNTGGWSGGGYDAGSQDSGSQDAGSYDAGEADTGSYDAGSYDTGSYDAGSSPDTGSTGGGSSSGGGSTALDCRDASTWPTDWVAYEDQILQLTNAERAAGASCGATYYSPQPALTADPQLREAARCHSLDMAVQDYFSHTSANGDSMSDRINATGYPWRSIGENIAAGYRDPISAMVGWMNSDGHCRNIMSGFTELGVGYVYLDNNRYGYFWTQNFGIPR